jgi:putative ABC transport system permease protein
VGAAVVFLGVAMLSPALSQPVIRVLGWPFARLAGPVGRMSRGNAQRNPRRTAATASALMIGLALAAYPNVELQDRQQAKAKARGEVNQLLGMIIALLVLSIVIAALGIVNTLALSVTERTREIALLRAVGMSRRQLRRMLRYESVVIAAFGATLGLGIGVAFGWALQRVLADDSIDVLSVPFGQLALCVVAAAVLGVVAAIWPARRAARMDVLRAITTE